MSISYEEALATLQSMFGEPWTRETLDAVLRHQQGHMENTVDLVLRHGDRAPQVLVDQLQSGIDPQTQAMNADAQLARQISQQEQQLRSRSAARPGAAAKKGRGTPTTLPEDFLRLPNAAGGAAPRLSQMEQDEALARMLQDELFTQEISRNPDFAHLARGAPGRSGNRMIAGASNRTATPRASAAQHPNQPANPLQDVDIMKSLGDLGQTARKRLQLMANQFNAKMNQNRNNSGAQTGGDGGGAGGSSGHVSERRGLLGSGSDDGEDAALEFASRKDL